MNVAIIGGGWAGLSAAVVLARSGQKPVVFEASDTLGGRARTVHSPRLGIPIDNGQHILLGAYTSTLDLIKTLTGDVEPRLARQRFMLRSADGCFRLGAGALPAPWHLFWAIVSARGITPRERLSLARLSQRSRREHWAVPAHWTVAQWLEHNQQSDNLVRQLWQPLCLAALNTSVDQACAQTFCRVLGDSLGGPASTSDLLIPRVNLSDLWTTHLPNTIDVRRSTAVTKLTQHGMQFAVNDQIFDAIVLACPPSMAARLLQGMPHKSGTNDYLVTLSAYDYLPIATLTLKLARPWGLPHCMLMLVDSPRQNQFGQWLFNLARVADPDSAQASCATVVVSDARALLDCARKDAVEGMIRQVTEQTRRFPAMPEILGHELIIEKRATFAATPGLKRPGNRTPWAGIWTAGDWTDTAYPAVLEGAVRSGFDAAHRLLHSNSDGI